ncbi:MAG: hypothetical protein D6737_06495 [Chloroflexi bacterium]|nr:MAG: hypothetical protein D6737_06495 [Chloroflexota bacterium]
MTTIWEQINTAMAQTIAQAQASLVQIGRHERGVGAGVLYNRDGIIITNAHVVRDEVRHNIVMPNGETVTAEQVAQDDVYDLAALKVQVAEIEPIEHGDSRGLQPGQLVFALGHPWGITGTTTAGVVISAEERLTDRAGHTHPMIAVNIHLRPGNSGGPLIDSSGRLVGINTVMTGAESGMAIPAHLIAQFMQTVTQTMIV